MSVRAAHKVLCFSLVLLLSARAALASELTITQVDARILAAAPMHAEDPLRTPMSGTRIELQPPAGKKFLWIDADIAIAWGAADEELELAMSSVRVTDRKGVAAPFYAMLSRDGRIKFAKPERATVQARTQFKMKSVRISALWTVPAAETRFELSLGQARKAFTAKPGAVPRTGLMAASVTAAALVDELEVKIDGSFDQPKAAGTLRNPNGKLLILDFAMTPLVANSADGQLLNNGDFTDFALLIDGQYVRPTGSINQFTHAYTDRQSYSFQATNDDGTWRSQEVRLIFPVSAKPGVMKLTHLDTPIADVPAPR